MASEKKTVKESGQVFTPDYIVANILDLCGYFGKKILEKQIIDNSCGDGAFLCQVVSRYIETALKSGFDKKEIVIQLEKNIHGVDTDETACKRCIERLSDIAKKNNLGKVKWDIRNKDVLSEKAFDGKMDFVVGNPPYVRVHNLNDSYNAVKKFSFAEGGMTDLYLVFFEIGFNMLSKNGILCYITPSSWTSSLAGTNFRSYIKYHKNLSAVVDLEHFQPFEATTYTMISLFEKSKRKQTFCYYGYDEKQKRPSFREELDIDNSDIGGKFFFTKRHIQSLLKTIKTEPHPKIVTVKNGFATLADKVFIGDVPETSITIPIIKASTGKWKRGLYPYDETGTPIPEKKLFADKTIKSYFTSHKEDLLKDKEEYPGWFYYGRTQALKDVYKEKYSINTIIKDVSSIKLNRVPSGSGIYSGLYIVTDIDEKKLKEVLLCEEFIEYIISLKNYKSGGYYTFNSKDLEQYLNYRLGEMGYKADNEGLLL